MISALGPIEIVNISLTKQTPAHSSIIHNGLLMTDKPARVFGTITAFLRRGETREARADRS